MTHTDKLPTPATPGKHAVRRVAGAETEILEGYGESRLREVIYLDEGQATALLRDGSGRFEDAHPTPVPETPGEELAPEGEEEQDPEE